MAAKQSAAASNPFAEPHRLSFRLPGPDVPCRLHDGEPARDDHSERAGAPSCWKIHLKRLRSLGARLCGDAHLCPGDVSERHACRHRADGDPGSGRNGVCAGVLVIFRWDAPLFFANASVFREHVLRAAATAPTPTKWIVVAAEPVTEIDITAADMLAELDQRLHQAGMDLCFAELKGPAKDRLKRYGLYAAFGAENFFPTLGQAVDQYLARHQVEWSDWEDQS